MPSISLSYSDFKDRVDAGSLPVEHYQTPDIYFLVAYASSSTELQCRIYKSDEDTVAAYLADYPS